MSKSLIGALAKIDISMLAALRTALAERSVGKAALDVGLSQPAMSNALARLRTAFGDPLLVRNQGRMELTTRGQEVLEQLEVILPQIDRLAQPPVFDPTTAAAHFRIAANDHAVQILTPGLVAAMSRAAPRAILSVTTLQSREINAEIEEEYFDLRLGWLAKPPQTWFIRRLIDDRIVVVAGRDAGEFGDAITVEQFESLPHVGIRLRPSSDQTGMDLMLAERGIRRNVIVWVSNFSSIPGILRRSKLLAVMPETLARRFEQSGGIRVMEAPVQLDRLHLSMAWSPTVHHHPGNRWLRALLVEIAADIDARAQCQ